MRFSIVIPVYNVEKYVGKCLETVMNQTFQDFEVIIVDDETPDDSMAVIQPFADAHPDRIRIIHQKNTRQGGARNHGASLARGEYILFLDSDDYFRLDMLEVIDRCLRENPTDILVFRFADVTESGKVLREQDLFGMEPGVYSPREKKELLLLTNSPADKVYRREFYQGCGFKFPEKLLYEDAAVRILLAKAESIQLCGEILYYYVQHEGSTMHIRLTDKMLDILTVTDLIREELQKSGLYTGSEDVLELALIRGIQCIINIINRKDPNSPLQIPMADYIARNFPGYRENPYISSGMRRELDTLTAHEFRKYHYRILMVSELKARLLRWGIVAKLNELRKTLR